MSTEIPISVLLVGGALLSSLALWAVLLLHRFQGRPLCEYTDFREPSPRSTAATVLAGGTFFVASVLAGQLLGVDKELVTLHNVKVNVAASLAFLAMAPAVLVVVGRQPPWYYGIRFDQPVSSLVRGAATCLAIFLPVYVTILATFRLRSQETQHPYLKLLRHDEADPSAIVWIVLAAVVVAPLVEELLFRVLLQGWLRNRLRPWAAIVVASLVFALAHEWPDQLAIFPLALVLGYVYEKRQDYLTVVVAHALFNGFNVVTQSFVDPDELERLQEMAELCFRG